MYTQFPCVNVGLASVAYGDVLSEVALGLVSVLTASATPPLLPSVNGSRSRSEWQLPRVHVPKKSRARLVLRVPTVEYFSSTPRVQRAIQEMRKAQLSSRITGSLQAVIVAAHPIPIRPLVLPVAEARIIQRHLIGPGCGRVNF